MLRTSMNTGAGTRADVKRRAEEILRQIGIPRSTALELYYREIVAHNGIPFPVSGAVPPSLDNLTAEEFDRMMEIGLNQAKAGESRDMNAVFDELERGL